MYILCLPLIQELTLLQYIHSLEIFLEPPGWSSDGQQLHGTLPIAAPLTSYGS